MAIRFFDMFAGIGGFRSGLEAVGGFECIGHCEIDKRTNMAYCAIYDTEGEYYCDDARTINPDEMPDFDLLCAGFPCQSFSVAGKRLGFEDTRGTLFFEVARLLAAKRPAFFLLENVPGLLSHDGGKTLETIYAALIGMGYHLNGACITADISESPSSDGACILSDILIPDVPDKYFLSAAAMRRISGNLSEVPKGKGFTIPTE